MGYTVPPVPRGAWLALAAALLGWAFDGFEMGVFPVIARPAMRELLGPTLDGAAFEEVVRRWFAIQSAAFLVGAAVGGVLFGWLGDRVGRVRAMALSVLTYALLTGAGAWATSAEQLTGLRFLAALGMGGEWALGVALVMEAWPASYRPILAGSIGAAVALTAKVLSGEVRWRTMLGLCTLPGLLVFFLRQFVPESERWRLAVTRTSTVNLERVPPWRAGLGALASGVAILATWGAVQFTQPWAGEMNGSGVDVQLCSASAAIPGAVLAPILLARLGRRLGYAILCGIALLATEYLFLFHREYNASFLAAVSLAGACSATFYGWLPLYLPELFPTRHRAAGQGFCYNAGRVIAAAGVLTVAFAVDLKGRYPEASAVVCGVYLLGIGLARFLPETGRGELPG